MVRISPFKHPILAAILGIHKGASFSTILIFALKRDVMSSRLVSLPLELFRAITSLLLLPDQAALCRTDKTLNSLLTPIVWSEIELHHRGTHEGIDVESEIDSLGYEEAEEHMARLRAPEPEYPHKRLVLNPSSRKYAQVNFNRLRWKRALEKKGRRLVGKRTPGRATDNCNRRNFQFGREEQFVGVRKITSKERWAELSQHVRSLCMSIGVDDEVVKVIGTLQNLESLELIGLPLEAGHKATAPEVKLPRLQNLKLRGYFPAALIRKICNNAEHIRCLDLGLLATSTDDGAYADTLLKNDDNWAMVTSDQAEFYQRNGAEAATITAELEATGSNDESTARTESDEESDEDEDEDDDDDDDEQPWALHSPIWLPRSLSNKYTALTHLNLVRPYTGDSHLSFAHDSFAHIPHRYEQVLCKEWVSLLEATAGTLKELILEHRLPMEVGDTVGDGDPHPEMKGSNVSSIYSYRSGEPDRGDELFCRSVLRLLLEESNRFRELKQLSLRGIQIKGVPIRTDSIAVPGKNGAPNNDELLRVAFPNCEVELFENAYPIHVYAGYIMQSWDETRQEAMQDEGDGLLYNLSYYNDYKKRFGPQWRVKT